MKKIISLLLCALMIFSFAACSNNTPADNSASSSEPSSELQFSSVPELPSEPESSEPEAETSKILVVYFSATGSTKRIAESIAGAVGADLFELAPTEPYTDEDLDWTASGSRVNLEHDDESLRDVALTSTDVPNWDSYETVFIGYPIWWGIAAWPVDGFVKANDFTGKAVIPFATSLSSGMGESGTLLAELAGTGDWQDGRRFASGVSAEDVQAWVDSLELN